MPTTVEDKRNYLIKSDISKETQFLATGSGIAETFGMYLVVNFWISYRSVQILRSLSALSWGAGYYS